jgi:hypothetical protein
LIRIDTKIGDKLLVGRERLASAVVLETTKSAFGQNFPKYGVKTDSRIWTQDM